MKRSDQIKKLAIEAWLGVPATEGSVELLGGHIPDAHLIRAVLAYMDAQDDATAELVASLPKTSPW